jgi:ATP/maltotriose-dependent transcriptional regulator MalT
VAGEWNLGVTGAYLEVLRLIAADRTNQRIAHDLVVALDTVTAPRPAR